MFGRLGAWCHDRRRLVVVVWIVLLVAGNGIASSVGDAYRQDFSLEGFESTDGFALVKSNFDDGSGSPVSGQVVFEVETSINDPAVRTKVDALLAEVAKLDGVTAVQSPYGPAGAFQVAREGPKAGKIAYATVNLPEDIDFTTATAIGKKIRALVPEEPGLRVELGGFLFAEFEPPSAELFGLAFAVIILIVAFGSVLAMGLPVAVALFGIGIGGALVVLASNLIEVPDFAPFIGLMIGLGVGIDYALLIVTRYREQLHAGHDVRESIGIAMETAGRSVVFAGATVVISLLGMLLMGIGFVGGLGLTASLTVAVTIMASITFLPALLGFAGDNIERTKWRGLVAAGFVALALVGAGLGAPALIAAGAALAVVTIVAGFFVPALKGDVTHKPAKPRRETAAYRWSRVIQHRPWTSAIAASAVLLVLALPVLGLRLGFSDESNFAEDTTTKQAYNLIVEGFGKGSTGPVYLVAEVDGAEQVGKLLAVNQAVAADADVAAVLGPQPNDASKPSAVRWLVTPKTGPQDEATTELVNRLRDDVLPPIEQATGTQVLVSGLVAGNVDMSQYMTQRLPVFFGAVLALSFLLLMVVFRSLLVPLKAVVMNLLSIGAAYGVLVALFQWGWLGSVTGVSPGPIEPWVPMMLFAIVFGLSMDYEVFLLSRVREEWRRTGDSRTSVADGLAATAKVITAAAAIMVVVFGSFMLEFERTMKMMGTGLAVAILFDATIVRMLLVPATMELLGDRNWWLPAWLDRILPNLDVEGHDVAAAPLDEEPEELEPQLV
ncbi:MAG TPA: MMPL family transporter [Acidimicrobiales bacterium]|nr:MMPL family transporter [Acidimicrobiales bacterium]